MVHVTSYCVECKKKKYPQSRVTDVHKSHQRCPLVCSGKGFSPCPAWRSCQIAGHPEWGFILHYSSQIIWNSSIITYVVAQAVTVAPPGSCQSHHLDLTFGFSEQFPFVLPSCLITLSTHFTVMCTYLQVLNWNSVRALITPVDNAQGGTELKLELTHLPEPYMVS